MSDHNTNSLTLSVEEARLLRFYLADHLHDIEMGLMSMRYEEAALSALDKMPSPQEIDLSGHENFSVEFSDEELQCADLAVSNVIEMIHAGVCDPKNFDDQVRLLETLRTQ